MLLKSSWLGDSLVVPIFVVKTGSLRMVWCVWVWVLEREREREREREGERDTSTKQTIKDIQANTRNVCEQWLIGISTKSAKIRI